jgi:sRNA-binding regulator protein Hfq
MDLGGGSGIHDRSERISPREGELIKFRDLRTPLVFHMLTGDTIEGVIRWYDGSSVRVARPDSTEITLFFHALSYYENKLES